MLIKYDSVDQTNKNEMGGACSTYRRKITVFCMVDLRERGHLEHLAVGGRIILKWIFKKRH